LEGAANRSSRGSWVARLVFNMTDRSDTNLPLIIDFKSPLIGGRVVGDEKTAFVGKSTG